MAVQQDDTQPLIDFSGESTPERAIARARDEMNSFENVVLNIAITGQGGTGKSTFANAILGLDANVGGAADTGSVETTKNPTKYEHPQLNNVNIWDLPGIGTPKFKAKTYMKDVKFKDYDFFIIVVGERVTENDIKLAKELEKKKKKFYFVRSKIDRDVTSVTGGEEERNSLQKIRNYCENELGAPIFLISACNMEKFDFQMFQNTLEGDLGAHKRDALALCLPVYSRQSLDKKYEIFKKQIWALAVLAGGIGAAPLPFLSVACDTALVISFFTKCYYSFGLNDKSLEKMGKRVGDEKLKNTVRQSSFVVAIANNSFLPTKVAARLGTAGVVEALFRFIPIAGNIAAAGVSFATTRSVLLEGLNELYSVAQKVLQLAGLD